MNRRVQPAPSAAASAPQAAGGAGSAARNARPGFGPRQWLLHHRHGAADALIRLWRQPMAALMTLALGGLALALPLMLATVSNNLQTLMQGLRSSGQIAVFLDPGLDAASAGQVAARVRKLAGVAAVEVRTPAQGLQELRDAAGFAEAIAAIDGNPLPYLLLVQASPATLPDQLAVDLIALAEVDQVQHDQQWRQRLDRVLELLRRLAAASLLLFGVAALLVISNSVRLEVAARREEIGIVKLLGASDAFVRRPFLWCGFWLGGLSALIAVALSLAARAWFSEPARALAQSYGSSFDLQGPGTVLVLTTLAGGVLLGCAGAYIATTFQLISDRAS
jgi:cell division transport system permease protein